MNTPNARRTPLMASHLYSVRQKERKCHGPSECPFCTELAKKCGDRGGGGGHNELCSFQTPVSRWMGFWWANMVNDSYVVRQFIAIYQNKCAMSTPIHLIRCTTRPIHQHSTQFYVWDVKIQGQCNGQVDDETDENWWRICAKTDDGMELTVRYGLVCVGFAEHIFFGSLLSSDTNAGCKHWNGNVHGLGRWISDLIRFICTDDDRGETLMDFLSRSMNYAYLINGKVSMNNNPLLWHAHILLFLSCSNNGYWAIVATLRDCELWRSIERIDDANRKLLLCTERS